jgi:ribonuclease HI
MSHRPHYLLFSEASRNPRTAHTWRFVLQELETERRLCAADAEPGQSVQRLELLATVRGLEALEEPSRVTLITRSRYVSRGLRMGLDQWREQNWTWERFGRVVSVRDCDLWQRVDRALEFHDLSCQTWHFEAAHEESDVAALGESDLLWQEFESAEPMPRVRWHGRRRTAVPRLVPQSRVAAWQAGGRRRVLERGGKPRSVWGATA